MKYKQIMTTEKIVDIVFWPLEKTAEAIDKTLDIVTWPYWKYQDVKYFLEWTAALGEAMESNYPQLPFEHEAEDNKQ